MGTTICREVEAEFDPTELDRMIALVYVLAERDLFDIQGIFGNLGMYASGIPTGLLIDQRGPRWGVWLGAVLLAAGYYPIKLGRGPALTSSRRMSDKSTAFDAGAGSYPVPVLCIFSLFSGCGSCSAFNAALKTGMECSGPWTREFMLRGVQWH